MNAFTRCHPSTAGYSPGKCTELPGGGGIQEDDFSISYRIWKDASAPQVFIQRGDASAKESGVGVPTAGDTLPGQSLFPKVRFKWTLYPDDIYNFEVHRMDATGGESNSHKLGFEPQGWTLQPECSELAHRPPSSPVTSVRRDNPSSQESTDAEERKWITQSIIQCMDRFSQAGDSKGLKAAVVEGNDVFKKVCPVFPHNVSGPVISTA